jgi:hypothetical protein
MRRLAPLLLIAALALFAGCGDSSEETTATPTKSTEAEQRVRFAFLANPDCRPHEGASRWGCSVDSYRCQGVVTGRGWSVSCSKPGRSIACTIRPG